MIYIELILKKIYTRIEENTYIPSSELAYYRIFVGLIFLFLIPSYSWLSDVPPGFYKPNVLTLANFFYSLPNGIYFKISDLIIPLLLILVILGIKARFSFFLLFLITIINNSFAYSFGKIDHSIFISLTFLFFSFSNSGTLLALQPDKEYKHQKFYFSVFSLCLVFAFFTAGFEKAINWVDFNLGTSGVFAWFYNNYFTIDSTKLFADYFFYVPLWLVEFMDYAAVLFEVSGIIFLLYSGKSWRIYLITAAVFHLINGLILNIPFTLHVAVYGIWLLAPILYKYKWMILLVILPLFFPRMEASLVLWLLVICLATMSFRFTAHKR